MKNSERKFSRGALNHCYQNTVDGFLLFYSKSDYLVYFTTFCSTARRYALKVLSLCQMPDHIHAGIVLNERQDLISFFQEVSAKYAKADSSTCNRAGPLFNKRFGSAPKKDLKSVRTTLIYIGNNPVERKLCGKAPEYQWNYLSYAYSDHPFSEKLVIRKSS